MLIPRKIHVILEEMNDEVFKNMEIQNVNAIKRYIDRIIKFYQSQEADKDVYDIEIAIGDEKEISEAKENVNENNAEIATELSKTDKDAEDKQLFSALEYLDSIKKSDHQKFFDFGELLKAFVIGKIIDNESERVFLGCDTVRTQMFHFMNLINSSNFDINDKIKVDTCKSLLSCIKQGVLLNKLSNKFGYFTPVPFQLPPTPGIDPKIDQKAAAFDKIVEALRPFFIGLETEQSLKGFSCDSSLNSMNPMFK